MFNKKTIFLSLILVINFSFYGCPWSFHNDTDRKIVLTDNANHGLILEPQDKDGGTIDPTHEGWRGYFIKEKIYVYTQDEKNPKNYENKFELTEKICSEKPEIENHLNISELFDKPLKEHLTHRFKVEEIKPHLIKKAHKHTHFHI